MFRKIDLTLFYFVYFVILCQFFMSCSVLCVVFCVLCSVCCVLCFFALWCCVVWCCVVLCCVALWCCNAYYHQVTSAMWTVPLPSLSTRPQISEWACESASLNPVWATRDVCVRDWMMCGPQMWCKQASNWCAGIHHLTRQKDRCMTGDTGPQWQRPLSKTSWWPYYISYYSPAVILLCGCFMLCRTWDMQQGTGLATWYIASSINTHCIRLWFHY
mgnify:CR=1 FL=1